MKSIVKRTKKGDRERKVLLGLIDYFIKTGKPVGSNTLKEAGFDDLSSATIRNYFANLEQEGYLTQQHASGGRLPTHEAFRIYAQEFAESRKITPQEQELLEILRLTESREVAAYLQQAAEKLSSLTQTAVFLSAPRFDSDFIIDLKLVSIDHSRCLCVIVTDFGIVQSELLNVEKKLSSFSIKRIESYFHWRLTGHQKPDNLTPEEEGLAQKFYNEVMIRYIVGYSNFTNEEIYRTGFSKLLAFPEFQDPIILSKSLSLFENIHSMRLLLKECTKLNNLKFWIGEDLSRYTEGTPECAVIAAPYHINQQSVGAIGILGPIRMPYRELFGLLREFAESISEALTRSVYRFKISYRQPEQEALDLWKNDIRLIDQSRLILLEDKSQ
jgi:heat-inducible transcriptional repressor